MNTKVGLDYLPLDIDFFQDEKIQFVSAKYGMRGEIVAVRLLCKIYRQGYYAEWNDDVSLLFARSVGDGCDSEFVNDVVNELIKRDFFDNGMFVRHGILTSRGIQKRYFEATVKRKNVVCERRFLLVDVSKFQNVVILPEKVVILEQADEQSGVILTQSKVSKVKNLVVVVDAGARAREEEPEEPGEPDEPEEQVAGPPPDLVTFCEASFPTMSAAAYQELADFMNNDITADMVTYAVNVARDNGTIAWSYARAIMDSWVCKGIKSLDAARTDHALFKARGQPRSRARDPTGDVPDSVYGGYVEIPHNA